jgi:hypothetical protein
VTGRTGQCSHSARRLRWVGGLEAWTVSGELQGWQFQVDVIAAGLLISASAPGGDPAVGCHKMNGQRGMLKDDVAHGRGHLAGITMPA